MQEVIEKYKQEANEYTTEIEKTYKDLIGLYENRAFVYKELNQGLKAEADYNYIIEQCTIGKKFLTSSEVNFDDIIIKNVIKKSRLFTDTIYPEMENFEKGLLIIENYLKIYPNDLYLNRERASILVQLKRYQDALSEYKMVMSDKAYSYDQFNTYSDSVDDKLNLVICYMNLRMYDEAWETAHTIKKRNLISFKLGIICRILEMRGEYEKAIEYYFEMYKNEYNYVYSLKKTGYKKFIIDFSIQDIIDYDQIDIIIDIIRNLFAIGNKPVVSEYGMRFTYEKEAYNMCNVILYNANKFKDHQDEINYILYMKADYLYRKGKYSEALKEFNKLLLKEKESSFYYLERAKCYIAIHQYKWALKDIISAKECQIGSEDKDSMKDTDQLLYEVLNRLK